MNPLVITQKTHFFPRKLYGRLSAGKGKILTISIFILSVRKDSFFPLPLRTCHFFWARRLSVPFPLPLFTCLGDPDLAVFSRPKPSFRLPSLQQARIKTSTHIESLSQCSNSSFGGKFEKKQKVILTGVVLHVVRFPVSVSVTDCSTHKKNCSFLILPGGVLLIPSSFTFLVLRRSVMKRAKGLTGSSAPSICSCTETFLEFL